MDMIMMNVNDETETDLVNLRRTIYLTIMSTLDFEEAGHRLLKIKLNPGRQEEMQLSIIIIECCIQNKAYLPYYALLAQRFCMINEIHRQNFEKCFVRHYSMAHRLETNALINSARFFAHLIAFDALTWRVLAYLRLTEEDSTSSSRIFIKFLFQNLCEHLGLRRLNERLSDPKMKDVFESIFPRDSMRNTRFSINFFTAIGLGGITENLREWYQLMKQRKRDVDSDEESERRGSESDAKRRKRRRFK